MSLSVIAAAAAAVVGGTGAFFSDVETSTGNTFTAGAIDLKVDSKQKYNGNECLDVDQTAGVDYRWVGNAAYPKAGTPCTGAWELTDLGPTNQFFKFDDVKPGDNGSNSISLHVVNNDAWVCATVSNLTDLDNTLTEPEDADVDEIDNLASGELKEKMIVTIWSDNGQGGGTAGDNIQNGTEPTLFTGQAQAGTWPLYTPATTVTPLAGGATGYVGVAWSLPLATDNEVQTDSMGADISFNVVQARNNPNFTCTPPVQPEVDQIQR